MSINSFEEKIIDMEDGIRNHCLSVIHTALFQKKTDKEIAESIKDELEKKEEGKWNVVVGKNFGSHVVHRSRRYGYFHVGEISILIWQSGSPSTDLK
jgi:dynein light chain LC8-type